MLAGTQPPGLQTGAFRNPPDWFGAGNSLNWGPLYIALYPGYS